MYNIGDKIVYPMHGAGTIEAIEEKKVLGEMNQYYILRMSYDDLKFMFPTQGVAVESIRDVILPQEADKVIDYFNTYIEEVNTNWNKRYRENAQRIKSGNIYEVAQVTKMLMLRDKKKGLSSGERKMLISAKQILISELVLSKNTTQTDIEDRLEGIIDDCIKAEQSI